MEHDKILDELARLIAELKTATEAIGGAKSILDNVEQVVTEDKQIVTDPDEDWFFLNQIIDSDGVSNILGMTKANVSVLFNKGLIQPAKKIGRDWATTRSAIERYRENRTDRRGNPLFGTVYKGRKPKGLDAPQDTLSAHEETANEFTGHEAE